MLDIISEPSVYFSAQMPGSYWIQHKQNAVNKNHFDGLVSIDSKNPNIIQEYLPERFTVLNFN